jgi:hypothetical protein
MRLLVLGVTGSTRYRRRSLATALLVLPLLGDGRRRHGRSAEPLVEVSSGKPIAPYWELLGQGSEPPGYAQRATAGRAGGYPRE